MDYRRILRDLGLKTAALIVAAAIWLPCVHLLYRADPRDYRAEQGVASKAKMLAARHLDIWTDAELRAHEVEKMQARNPEWDFMARTYFVLSLANMALREPATYQAQACEIIDVILDNTIRLEAERGQKHFLLGYGHEDSWQVKPARSIFVDGEIAMMLAARRLVEEKPAYKPLLHERIDIMVRQMRKSPVLCAESYPFECWIFCNTVALASMRMADALDGTDHSPFLSEWLSKAKQKLIEPTTGGLVSAFEVNGTPAACGFCPEGTSIWMASHMLELVDSEFAADQYRRARKDLAGSFLGFGYSREWPRAIEGWWNPELWDVDSGPVPPVLGVSASASGLAIMGAAAFDDDWFLSRLLTSLNLGGFPTERDGRLQYMASNPVGDAVLLYAMVEGPLWAKVQGRTP